MVVSLVFTGPGSSVALAQATDTEIEAALVSIAETGERLDRAAETLPDAYFSRDDLAFDLAFEDAETIAAWVRDEIAYQPYRGVLRGADGTLISGAGNAWDQSLLLVGLLLDAGYEARIAGATLDEAAASSLVTTMAPWRDVTVDEEAFLAAYATDATDEAVAVLAEQRGLVEAQLQDESRSTAAWITTQLESAGIALGGEEDLAAARSDATDYAWVQVRAASDEPWSNVHPAAPPEAEWTEDLEPARTVEGGVPEDLQHRFRVEAVIERRAGADLETAPVMTAWERPIANLNGVALNYMAIPDGFVANDPNLVPSEAYENSNLVVPFFNGEMAVGAQFFDLDGNTVPSDAAAGPAAGLFQSVGGLFGDAIGGIGGEGAKPVLTAHWLEYTIIAPGGEETSYRRMVFDRLGEPRRASGDATGDLVPFEDVEILQMLHAENAFMLAPGTYPDAYVRRAAIEGSQLGIEFVADTLVSTMGENPTLPEPPAGLSSAANAANLLALFEAFDEPAAPEGVPLITYRATPTLVATTLSPDGAEARVDIVANKRRSFVLPDAAALEPAFDANLEAGVRETAVERSLFAEGETNDNTFTFFERASEQGLAVRTFAPGSDMTSTALDLPASSLWAMQQDLDAGYAVITAEAVPDASRIAAWWRVDPATGETLGRGSDGRGIDLTTYGTLIGFGISVAFAAAGFLSCMSQDAGELGCCAVDGAIGFTAGMIFVALGFMILEVVAAGAAAKITAGGALGIGAGVDVAAFAAGLAGALPSFCGGGDASMPSPENLEAVLSIDVDEPYLGEMQTTCPRPTSFEAFLKALHVDTVATEVSLL